MVALLLIEDDAAIRDNLSRSLQQRGHGVESAENGLDGLRLLVAASPELVILDLGLPDIDGLELLRMLRAVSNVPVIVATARDRDDDVVSGLDAGADDYIVKPFSANTLDARIRAVLRRSDGPDPDDVILVGGLRIDARTHEATLDGRALLLTRKEYELLDYLARRPGTLVTKRELMADIWDLPYGGGERTIDVHLSWLRTKLGESAKSPQYLHTVRGVGVRLVAPP